MNDDIIYKVIWSIYIISYSDLEYYKFINLILY